MVTGTLEFLLSPKDTTRTNSNHLVDSACFAIAEGLAKNRVLRSLCICGVQITEARTVTALATMVEGLTMLETFQLEGEVGSRGTAENGWYDVVEAQTNYARAALRQRKKLLAADREHLKVAAAQDGSSSLLSEIFSRGPNATDVLAQEEEALMLLAETCHESDGRRFSNMAAIMELIAAHKHEKGDGRIIGDVLYDQLPPSDDASQWLDLKWDADRQQIKDTEVAAKVTEKMEKFAAEVTKGATRMIESGYRFGVLKRHRPGQDPLVEAYNVVIKETAEAVAGEELFDEFQQNDMQKICAEWHTLGEAFAKNRKLRSLTVQVSGLNANCAEAFMSKLSSGTTLRDVSGP